MKKCLNCRKEKEISEFCKSPAADGMYYCKSCMGSRKRPEIKKKKKRRKRGKKKKCEQIAPDWLKKYSKEERKELRRRRKERVRLATPKWANKRQMQHIYRIAREKGMHVDHIVPIMHKKVCGLHCEDNLQIMSPKKNIRKGNHFEI